MLSGHSMQGLLTSKGSAETRATVAISAGGWPCHEQQAGVSAACQALSCWHQLTLQGAGITELQGLGCLNLCPFQLSTGLNAGSLCSLHYLCTWAHLRAAGHQPAASEAKYHILQQQDSPLLGCPKPMQASAS